MREILKRVIDITIAALLLGIVAIPLAIASVLLKLESDGPAIFQQKRVGKDGKVFTLYKLRSMRASEVQEDMWPSSESVTRVGVFIRKWRIDELPQLVNVIKGDMSIVGPRPTLEYQVDRYNAEQARRLTVKPGITGWAQIHGDEAISWPDRIELDLWYIDNWSISLDLKIIALTPHALLRLRKINADEGPPPDEISVKDS